MTAPADDDLFALLEATWPPRSRHSVGPWTIRDGAGGGSRVAAATATGPVTPNDVSAAAEAMAALGQEPLVQVRPGQTDLDALLADLDWKIADPTLILAAPAAHLAADADVRTIWPPDAAARDLWDALGTGAARLAVMDRVDGPKTVVAARIDGQPAGLAVAALHGRRAMVHAMAVHPAQRRRRLGRGMLAVAGAWARARGADRLALAVTDGNAAARALYAAAGFVTVSGYHYRVGGRACGG